MWKVIPVTHIQPPFLCLFAATMAIAAPGMQAGDSGQQPLLIGVDANYSLDMEKGGVEWMWDGKRSDLFEGLAKRGVSEFRLTPEGQSHWLSDFFTFCSGHPDIHAVFYWSPEWYGEGMWKGFALFDPKGRSRPAWAAFSAASLNNQDPD